MKTFRPILLLGLAACAVPVLLLLAGAGAFADPLLAALLGLSSPVPIPVFWTALLTIAATFGVACIWCESPEIGRKSVFVLVFAAMLAAFPFVLALHGVLFSPLAPLAGLLSAVVLPELWVRSNRGRRRFELESLFRNRLSRPAYHNIQNVESSPEHPPRVVNATVIVLTVQNHAELMEMLPPDAYVEMTNLYLKTASDFLVESGGYLDECNGECIRVVFGAPLPAEGHAVKACRAAIDVFNRLQELNKECDARWQRRLDVRIGLDTGDVIAGVFGGGRVGSFSVAGPAVDFARRLCAACSNYGARILIGPDAYTPSTESVEVRPVELLKVSSKRRRLEIYEILAPRHGLSPERERSRDHFWTGVLHYREKQWDKALAEFTKARIPGIPDDALDYYIRRVDQARQGADSHRETIPPFSHAA